MQTILLKAEKRNNAGTSSAKALRQNGQVPCVMYGSKENQHFAVYLADFKNLVYTPKVYKVRIDIDGTHYDAVLQDLQYHPVNDQIMHADFLEVDATRKVVMEIPVNVVGNSPGVRAGGKLVKKITKLRVRGLIKDLPDFIDVNIDTLEIGQSVKVKDVTISGFDLLDAKENAIISCKTTRALMQAAADEKKK